MMVMDAEEIDRDTMTMSQFHHEDVALPDEEPLISPTVLARSNALSVSTNPSQRPLTYFNCLSIVLGIQIGSGIFSTPAVISNHVSTPIAGVFVWTLAGVLVWTGASCFIELGTLISHNGGMQEYLRKGYGDLAGFMFSSVWLSIVRPCSIALIAMIFSEHVNRLLLQELAISGGWFAHKSIALIVVWTLTAVNCQGITTGAKVAGWFLVLKLVMLISIVVAGIFECVRERGGHLLLGAEVDHRVIRATVDHTNELDGVGAWNLIGEYVTALLAALWVYGGWESVGFVAGEMENPVRDIPRVLNSAMFVVVSGFTLASVAFYVVLPISVVRENDTPAVTFAEMLYGHIGFLLYTTGISLSAMGAINSNIFAVSRLVVSASHQNYLPSLFDTNNRKYQRGEDEERMLRESINVHWPSWIGWCIKGVSRATRQKRLERGIPIYATLLTSLLTSVYILAGTFRSLITFIGIVEYLIFMFTVLALIPLRQNSSAANFPARNSTSATSYRTYTANIIIFCAFSCFLVIRGVITEPVQGLMILLVSSGLYGIWKWKQPKTDTAAHMEDFALEES